VSAIVLSVEWQIGGGPSEPSLHRFVTACERAGAELADVGKHILPKLLPVLEVETVKQFAAQGAGPQAGSWAPLSVSYARWKEAHFPGKPTLVRTGKLADALADSGAPGARRDITGDSLTFGTVGLPYASFHQTGTGKMPERPPFDFGPDFEAAMQGAVAQGVREAVRAAFDGLADFEGDEFEGQQVLSGKRGGRYIVGSNGRRTYLKQGASGAVTRRTFR
jgi:phage gpG-like protein